MEKLSPRIKVTISIKTQVPFHEHTNIKYIKGENSSQYKRKRAPD